MPLANLEVQVSNCSRVEQQTCPAWHHRGTEFAWSISDNHSKTGGEWVLIVITSLRNDLFQFLDRTTSGRCSTISCQLAPSVSCNSHPRENDEVIAWRLPMLKAMSHRFEMVPICRFLVKYRKEEFGNVEDAASLSVLFSSSYFQQNIWMSSWAPSFGPASREVSDRLKRNSENCCLQCWNCFSNRVTLISSCFRLMGLPVSEPRLTFLIILTVNGSVLILREQYVDRQLSLLMTHLIPKSLFAQPVSSVPQCCLNWPSTLENNFPFTHLHGQFRCFAAQLVNARW